MVYELLQPFRLMVFRENKGVIRDSGSGNQEVII